MTHFQTLEVSIVPFVTGENEWGQWEDWCECSQTCGTGFQIRKRQCLTFNCQGPIKESKTCTNPACPICM